MLEKDLEIGKHYVFERKRIEYLGNDGGFMLYDEKDFAIKKSSPIFIFRMDNGGIKFFDSLQAVHKFNKEKDKH